MPSSAIRSSAASNAGRFPWMSVITATLIGTHRIALTNITSIDRSKSMAVDLPLAPKTKRPAGEPCCEPVVYPDVERAQAIRMAEVAKALGDPIRLQLGDV